MDNHESDRDNNTDKSNTEYVPTKCRITRPPPPKPATNPLQFIKVAPCPLYRKAQEQLKKVEEIKTTKQHVREEAEDWQQNLDNWKSCRRKRQEHIIERVVEVKKLEQEEMERTRRKSKTFNEMIEDRSKGRHKFNIPIYDDDSNDLSDYGIGSSSSKTNSIKDVDTDDSSILDEKDQTVLDSTSGRETNVSSNQSQSEDEVSTDKNKKTIRNNLLNNVGNTNTSMPLTTTSSIYKLYNSYEEESKPQVEHYTYEGAIQDYRTRIKSKINISESIFNKSDERTKSKEYLESQTVVPKGQIFKRKEIFELEKPLEIHHIGSSSSKRLSEDFANAQSIKERLQNFEKCVEQNTKCVIPSKPTQLNKTNNNEILEPTKTTKDSNENVSEKNKIVERPESPETELYMNKLNVFNNELDTLYSKHSNGSENDMDELGFNSNYPASTSSTELMTTLSDKEDSGIHTADVSCSVSQADEPVELIDLTSSTIPHCIEKLSLQKADIFTKTFLLKRTEEFLRSEKKHSNETETKPLRPPREDTAKPIIYENVELKPSFPESYEVLTSDFPLAPPKVVEPPKAKPPPPPPPDTEESPEKPKPNVKRLNSTKRIKKEIHIKRSSFLGLNDSYDEPVNSEVVLEKPPDIYSFLQRESKLEKSLYKKLQESTELSKACSQDSGLDVDRGRLSSDTWCSSVGDSSTISHGRQDSEHTSSVTSEEDEIMKKEREIIEMVEKEEKSRDTTEVITEQKQYHHYNNTQSDHQYYNQQSLPDDRDSEVLKVEHELLQLEKEQLRRQQEQVLFSKRLQSNRHSMENVCDDFGGYVQFNQRKSMPELQQVPLEYRKSMPDVINAYRKEDYRKSMPDIQHGYHKSGYDCKFGEGSDHRKSLPELKSAFCSPVNNNKAAILPGKPIGNRDSNNKRLAIPRHQFPAVNPAPKIVPSDNWIQPRVNPEIKNYNQHWLYQEAELRRISEHQAANRNRQQKQEKHIPDCVIKSLTQRVQNKANNFNRDFLGQHSYMNPHSQTLGHALPMSYPQSTSEDTQDRVLSVSGKKKCSYCGNELGRGAAMIIESLCLFYHMECFKCCVCHVQLGDGLMGTDVRVRNQKLHCHNCYSSDDGVKFSCV